MPAAAAILIQTTTIPATSNFVFLPHRLFAADVRKAILPGAARQFDWDCFTYELRAVPECKGEWEIWEINRWIKQVPPDKRRKLLPPITILVTETEVGLYVEADNECLMYEDF